MRKKKGGGNKGVEATPGERKNMPICVFLKREGNKRPNTLRPDAGRWLLNLGGKNRGTSLPRFQGNRKRRGQERERKGGARQKVGKLASPGHEKPEGSSTILAN